MARNKSIDDETLIIKLTQAFRDYGYEGASLNILSNTTGLKKASLYHRFPGGKEEMALEVLSRAGNWVGENIVAPLTSNIKPETKVKIMVKKLDEFYSCGNDSCLLNMLASPEIAKGPFTSHIKEAFEVWIKTLTDVLVESGIDRKESRQRAENAVAMIQGTLVMSRGMNDNTHFKNLLKNLPKMLLDKNT